MTAEIIEMWLHRKGVRITTPAKQCMYEPRRPGALIDRHCACQGCREFFSGMQRSTSEIWDELRHLRMRGEEDKAKRNALISELQADTRAEF